MTVKSQTLIMQLKIKNCVDAKEAVKIIRSYSGSSVIKIFTALKNEGVVFEKTLAKKDFYVGWREIYNLARDLKVNFGELILFVNSKETDLSFLDDIKQTVECVRKEDIY